MAKTEEKKRNQNNKEKEKRDGETKKAKGKSGKRKEKKKEYKPGMSYLYEPCPHRVWTPKPGERDKSEPRGVGSPWYEPVKKKEVVDREEAEKNKKKEDRAQKRRQKAYEERKKAKEEEEKKKKKEDEKKEKEQKKKDEEKQKKKEERKKKREEKRKKKMEERRREREKKEKEEKKRKEEGKGEEKVQPLGSYAYEPCPHKVYNPAPGEREIAEPRGVGSPWYVPVRKKCDIDKEEEERREEENKKRTKEARKRHKEMKEQQENEEAERRKLEEEENKRIEAEAKKREMRRQRKLMAEKYDEPQEMGAGVRDDRTDISGELIWLMDFMRDVDDQAREKRGQQLRWRKEEIEDEIDADIVREAFITDFKDIVRTFVEAEWMKADREEKRLKKKQRRMRKEALKNLKNLDPLANDLLEGGQRFKSMCDGAMRYVEPPQKRKKTQYEKGEPCALEDMMVSMMTKQMDKLDTTQLLSWVDMF